jgi:hypothetical protein
MRSRVEKVRFLDWIGGIIFSFSDLGRCAVGAEMRIEESGAVLGRWRSRRFAPACFFGVGAELFFDAYWCSTNPLIRYTEEDRCDIVLIGNLFCRNGTSALSRFLPRFLSSINALFADHPGFAADGGVHPARQGQSRGYA